jgi:putative PIN family toxin of toxin-antitoxin system
LPTNPRRHVVDTNVLISALLQPGGRTAEVLLAIRTHDGILLLSDQTFEELATRLMRAKFDRYASNAVREQFLADIAGVAEWVVISGTLRGCRDPDDDKFLETAITGEADCIITGDGDLLALDPFGSLRIVSPRAFLEASLSEQGTKP